MKYHFLTFLVLFPLTIGTEGCALLSGSMQKDRFPASEPSEYDDAAGAEEMRRLQVERALEYREIVPGMNMEDVRSVWGIPGDVEIAGDPALGNQRWIYHDGLSGPWSTRRMSPSRIVYFESGRVAGWKRD